MEAARVHRFKKGSGLPIKAPVIDMIEIGAGGGSIARVDQLGLLKVGPRSAGADPGPACYGLGGKEPTVTDANLLLGYLDADFFLGGRMHLGRARRRQRWRRVPSAPAVPPWRRRGASTRSSARHGRGARVHIVEKGHDLGATRWSGSASRTCARRAALAARVVQRPEPAAFGPREIQLSSTAHSAMPGGPERAGIPTRANHDLARTPEDARHPRGRAQVRLPPNPTSRSAEDRVHFSTMWTRPPRPCSRRRSCRRPRRSQGGHRSGSATRAIAASPPPGRDGMRPPDGRSRHRGSRAAGWRGDRRLLAPETVAGGAWIGPGARGPP